MDIWLIVAIAVAFIAIVARLATRKHPDPDARQGGKVFTIVMTVIALFLLGMSAFKIVPTNTIGIYTSFGKPVDARPNGFQGKLPWQKVVEFDASRQYLKFEGGGNDKTPAEDGKLFPAVPVKMEREARASVVVVVGWQLKADTEKEREQTIELYKAHKTFDRLTENFMAANVRAATQSVYDKVNPLVPESNPTFAELSSRLLTEVRILVGDEVKIISAQVVGVDYDDKTDGRIAEAQAEYAKTQLAEQQRLTNEKISAANAALEQSLSPEVLQARCLDIAQERGLLPGACLQPGWSGIAGPQQPAK